MYDDGVGGVRGGGAGEDVTWLERDGLLYDRIREKRKEGDGTIRKKRDGRGGGRNRTG